MHPGSQSHYVFGVITMSMYKNEVIDNILTCNSIQVLVTLTHPHKPGLFACKLALTDPLREVHDFSRVEQLYKSRTLQMATKILSDPTHFLHDHYDLLPSGRRNRMPIVKIQRALKSFIASFIKYLNQPHKINN